LDGIRYPNVNAKPHARNEKLYLKMPPGGGTRYVFTATVEIVR
jgi:hypothetical protein